MAVNQYLIEKSKWRERVTSACGDTWASMMKPYTLEDWYPAIDVEDPPESGHYKMVKTILPHQRKFHEGITPTGRRADFILQSGGVGSGKTLASIVQLVHMMKKYPGLEVVGCTAWDFHVLTLQH